MSGGLLRLWMWSSRHYMLPVSVLLVLLVATALALAAEQNLARSSDNSEHEVVATTLEHRDPMLDVPLAELLAYPLRGIPSPVDARLQHAFASCRASGVGGVFRDHARDTKYGDGAELDNLTDNDDGDGDGEGSDGYDADATAYCDAVRYTRHVRQKYRALWQMLATENVEREEQAKDGEIATHHDRRIPTRASDSLTLQVFFEEFAELQQPVVLRSPASSAESSSSSLADPAMGLHDEAKVSKWLDACFQGDPSEDAASAINEKPLQWQDPACALLLKHVRVPLVMVHNYVARTPVALAPAFLPTLTTIKRNSHDVPTAPSFVQTCPHGMHTLLQPLTRGWTLEVALLNGTYKPFQAPQAASAMGAASVVHEVTLSSPVDAALLLDTAQDKDDLLRRVQYLHALPRGFQGHVASRELLFIPGAYFAAARFVATDDSDSSTGRGQDDEVSLLRFCYADASNVNAVKKELVTDALVDDAARVLFQSLRAASFDTSMFRRPQASDAEWSHLYRSLLSPDRESVTEIESKANPGAENRADAGADAADADAETETETEDAKASQQSKPRRRRRSDDDGSAAPLSRRERLKLWQEDKRWDRHIESLTLPVPLPPVVIPESITRSTVRVVWQDLYRARRHDITVFGYEVEWQRDREEEQQQQQQLAEDDPHTNGEPEAGAMNVTRGQLVRSAMPSLRFGDDFDGQEITGMVTGLRPDTAYVFRVRIWIAEASGMASEWSRRLRTSPRTAPSVVRGVPSGSGENNDESMTMALTCVVLRWLEPEDDGGRAIDSYLVEVRQPRESSSTTTEEVEPRVVIVPASAPASTTATGISIGIGNGKVAPWQHGHVCNLLPCQRYRFRVAAANAVGIGPWSARSAAITAGGSSPSIPTLQGIGDPAYAVVPPPLARQLIAPQRVRSGGHGGGDGWKHSSVSVWNATSSLALAAAAAAFPRVLLSDVLERVTLLAAHGLASDKPTDSTDFDVWAGHFSPRRFHVLSQLVRADPVNAATPLRNHADVRDRVVLVERGGVPFVFKVLHAQHAGALGVIIADVNGTCGARFDQSCVPGATRARGEGFGASDGADPWRSVRIPVVLALQETAQSLLQAIHEA